MNLSARATAITIVDAIKATGTKAPKITEAFDKATRISTAAHGLGLPSGTLIAAVADALGDDRDPAADPEVGRIVTLSAIAGEGVMQGVTAIAFDDFRAVCSDERDDLVNAWQTPFDASVATLEAAHDRIGHLALDETGPILAKGGDIATVWAQARAAAGTIDTIAAGWIALGTFTRAVSDDPRRRALRLVDVDYTTWVEAKLEHKRLTPWDAVLAGLTLSLPTFDEYRQRIARITAEVADAERAFHADALAYATGRPALVRIPR